VHPVARSLAILAVTAASVRADPTSGVDAVLFRPSYDVNGVFAIEGARLMPVHDMSLKLFAGYAEDPIDAAVPGIGTMAGDTTRDHILNYVATLDFAFGMTLTDRVAFGFEAAGYRTAVGPGYGVRGLYGTGGQVVKPSTGLISLRPLSNIDPSASPNDPSAYLGDNLAGPLDVHVGLKIALYRDPHVALTAIGSVFLPFGDENMLLGDAGFVYEPKLAFEWRPDPNKQTRIVANLSARIRHRTVLEAYDGLDPTATADDAKVFMDIGSEAIAGIGAVWQVAPRFMLAAEAQGFIPLPDSLSYGTCTRYDGSPCSSITSADYWPGAKHGDLTSLATVGAMIRVSPDLTANIMVGTEQGGDRGAPFLGQIGITWAPQPIGAGAGDLRDRDGDGIPDSRDACPDEPEDKDGFQDEDGCPDPDNDGDGIPDAQDKCPDDPEDKDGFQDADGCPDRDNDNDGIPDAVDKCPNDPEDKDGFQDDDGCPDMDNDGDGIPDDKDKCPNDPETFNGFEDADGCPDVRATNGPEERPDRIDLKGQPISFDRNGKLTAQSKQLLQAAAAIIKARQLTIRVEVHVALGTKSANAAVIAAQKKRDKQTAQRRAQEILSFMVSLGVSPQQIQAVGIGSERPLGSSNPTDPSNDRIDLIKAQQGGVP
jgi:outer membrane protein OmpA-like peptidoglycan-associated protein